MAGQKISQLTLREALKGTEEIPFRDGDTNGKLTPDGIKKHVQPDLTGYLKQDDAEKTYVKREEGK